MTYSARWIAEVALKACESVSISYRLEYCFLIEPAALAVTGSTPHGMADLPN